MLNPSFRRRAASRPAAADPRAGVVGSGKGAGLRRKFRDRQVRASSRRFGFGSTAPLRGGHASRPATRLAGRALAPLHGVVPRVPATRPEERGSRSLNRARTAGRRCRSTSRALAARMITVIGQLSNIGCCPSAASRRDDREPEIAGESADPRPRMSEGGERERCGVSILPQQSISVSPPAEPGVHLEAIDARSLSALPS